VSTVILINVICIAVITANAMFVLSRWSPRQLSPWLQIGIFAPFLFAMGNLGSSLFESQPQRYVASLLILYTGLIWTVTTWWLVTVHIARVQGMRWRVPFWLWSGLPLTLATVGWIASTTNPWHGLFLTPMPGSRSVYGPLWYANGVFLWSLILCTVLLAVYRHRSAEFASDRAQMRLCALSSALPTLLNATYTLAPSPVEFDPTVVGLAISTSMLVIAIFRGQLHPASTVRLEEWIGDDPVAGLLADRNGRILFANDAVQRLFGESPGNERVAPWVYERLVHESGRTPTPTDDLGLLQLKNRPDVWVELEKRPILLVGTEVGTAWFFHDETQWKQLDTTVQAARKVESLGLIAGGVAHDFNNLLVSINGNAELASTFVETDPVRVREYLERIRRAGEQGADLARQLLTYAGKGQVTLTEVDLNRLAEDTIDMLRPSWRGSIDLTVETDHTIPPRTLADATQLAQLLLNLIINAREAIGDNRGKIRVAAGTTVLSREEIDGMLGSEDAAAGDYVYLLVEDNGAGIAQESLTRIFDPFYSTKAVGRGLGLSSTLGAIRKHHGCCKVVSAVGRGTTFIAYLPRIEMQNTITHDSLSFDPTAWRGRHALLLDDNVAVRRVHAQMLEHLGFVVADAGGSLPDALEPATGSDIAMIDLTMPGLRTADVIERLRTRNPRLPIIIVSGYNTLDPALGDCFETWEHIGFLQKPFNLGRLGEVIAQVLSSPTAGSLSRENRLP
jgi:signal transduction histidine kinase